MPFPSVFHTNETQFRISEIQFLTCKIQFHKTENQFHTIENRFQTTQSQFHIKEYQFCKNEIQFHIDNVYYLCVIHNVYYIASVWTQMFELILHKLHVNNIQVTYVFLHFMMHKINPNLFNK